MTPKEKAKELVDKFYTPLPLIKEVITKVKKIPFEYNDWNVATQCALIAVDEVLNELFEMAIVTGSSYVHNHIDYWQEVKQEIEKL